MYNIRFTVFYEGSLDTESGGTIYWTVSGYDGIFYIDYGIIYPPYINVWNYISSFTTGVRVSYNTDSDNNDYQDFSINVNSSTQDTKSWNEYNNDMASINDVSILNSSSTSRTSTLYSSSSVIIRLEEYA